MTKAYTSPTFTRVGMYIASQEKKDKLFGSVGQAIYVGALRRAWQALPVSGQDTLKALLEASNHDTSNQEAREEVEQFLSKHVPDWDRYLSEEARAIEEMWHKTYGEAIS